MADLEGRLESLMKTLSDAREALYVANDDAEDMINDPDASYQMRKDCLLAEACLVKEVSRLQKEIIYLQHIIVAKKHGFKPQRPSSKIEKAVAEGCSFEDPIDLTEDTSDDSNLGRRECYVPMPPSLKRERTVSGVDEMELESSEDKKTSVAVKDISCCNNVSCIPI